MFENRLPNIYKGGTGSISVAVNDDSVYSVQYLCVCGVIRLVMLRLQAEFESRLSTRETEETRADLSEVMYGGGYMNHSIYDK